MHNYDHLKGEYKLISLLGVRFGCSLHPGQKLWVVGGNDLKQTEDTPIHHCRLQLFYPPVFILPQIFSSTFDQPVAFVSHRMGDFAPIYMECKDQFSVLAFEMFAFLGWVHPPLLLPAGGRPCLPAFCRGGHWSVMPANEGKQETQ